MTEHDIVISCWPDEGLHGRARCYTDKKEITLGNVVDVVSQAYSTHQRNKAQICYLYDYFRGKQDIRGKQKQVRPEINNKVVVNRANEIVTFKSAYFLDEPIQYISNGGDETTSKKVQQFNDFMVAEDKVSLDKEIVDWMHICGVGVRMVIPDEQPEENGSPLLIYALDPREAFVIYHSGLGHKPMAGVVIQKDEDGQLMQCVYTENFYCEIKDGKAKNIKARATEKIKAIKEDGDGLSDPIDCDPVKFWAALNATYSDMCEFFKKYNINKLDAYVDHTITFWFKDQDSADDKLSAYYAYVVKH